MDLQVRPPCGLVACTDLRDASVVRVLGQPLLGRSPVQAFVAIPVVA